MSIANINPMKKIAVTICEILIVMGIIGIVAEYTIPVLINSAGSQATISSVKEAYSMLNLAIQNAKAENGEAYGWYQGADNSAATTKVNQIFAQMLKVANNCETNTGCFSSDTYRWLNTGVAASNDLQNIDASAYWTKVQLSSGMSLGMHVTTGSGQISGITFVVDINGQKAPNRWGYDLFEFVYNQTDNNILPRGYQSTTNNDGTFGGCYSDSTSSDIGGGEGCATWVILNNTTDYQQGAVLTK